MARKRYTAEQIIRHLRQAEVLSSQGRSVSEICREIGITENTYYRWRKEYRGMGQDQAVRVEVSFKMPLEDMFWGDRYGQLRDPFGHVWSLATHVRDVSYEEMEQGAESMCGGSK